MKRFIRSVFRGFVICLVFFLVIEVVIYFLTPVYDFPEPRPFSGEKFYNPYAGLDSLSWKKCNFHFHSREWWGLTAGSGNDPMEIYRTYKMLGYDAAQISNYQSISRVFADSAFYVPAYEHGFGIRKKHHMLIGSHQVLWLDYSLFQNINHKQHILDLLRPQSDIVAIAHPDWDNGFSLKDMKYLSNYDLIEALDNNWRSFPQWDAALSSGHVAWILADDDAHDINDPFQVQRCVTYVNSPVLKGDSIIRSLKSGKAYGVEMYMGEHWTFARKAGWAKQTRHLNSVTMNADTLKVSVSGKVFKMMFIGQDGRVRKTVYGDKGHWYRFTAEDTYIRTVVVLLYHYPYPVVGTGDVFYLNPVFRYKGELPVNDLKAEINWPRTWIFRVLTFGPLLFILLAVYRFRRSRKPVKS